MYWLLVLIMQNLLLVSDVCEALMQDKNKITQTPSSYYEGKKYMHIVYSFVIPLAAQLQISLHLRLVYPPGTNFSSRFCGEWPRSAL